jgi:2-polyprenyl-6-methoxyphenol hydroxylase-like FAD-dependent oxidoreductase
MTPESPADLIVVGGGPAGMLSGLLFARAGCRVRVLEKHSDFFRDFRGDTVHPSSMEILDQLGMLERFLERPHSKVYGAELDVAGKRWKIADLSRLDTPAPFVAMMPQWDFLDFLREEARAFPAFSLAMDSPVAGFIEEQGRVAGVRLESGGPLRARLTIAADGRDSIVRSGGLLPVATLGAPIDVFWFRIGKDPGGEAVRGSFERGRLLVLIDRGDYWQCALVIPKGKAEEWKAGGIGPIREAVHAAAPDIDSSELDEIDDLKLLSVKLDRLTRWHRPGLLAIGDAAHAMSPIGGVGINLAVQDAVAAANALAAPLARGDDVDSLLHEVQDRRLLPTRIIQSAQRLAQDRVIGRLLEPGAPIRTAPLPIRLLDRFALLRRIPGRLIGLGIRRERVESPDQPRPGP